MNSIPRTPPRRAFTLIELLVVIAIIAILASMFLPALSKAKEKTVQTKCTGNQKQLMLAAVMYMTDSDDYTPHPNWDFDRNIPGWLMAPTGSGVPGGFGPVNSCHEKFRTAAELAAFTLRAKTFRPSHQEVACRAGV